MAYGAEQQIPGRRLFFSRIQHRWFQTIDHNSEEKRSAAPVMRPSGSCRTAAGRLTRRRPKQRPLRNVLDHACMGVAPPRHWSSAGHGVLGGRQFAGRCRSGGPQQQRRMLRIRTEVAERARPLYAQDCLALSYIHFFWKANEESFPR